MYARNNEEPVRSQSIRCFSYGFWGIFIGSSFSRATPVMGLFLWFFEYRSMMKAVDSIVMIIMEQTHIHLNTVRSSLSRSGRDFTGFVGDFVILGFWG